jgi:putative endonuclease
MAVFRIKNDIRNWKLEVSFKISVIASISDRGNLGIMKTNQLCGYSQITNFKIIYANKAILFLYYIMINNSNTATYVGVTNDLNRRIYEHKNKLIKGFTCKYNITKLVYYEVYNNIIDAIAREKQIKAGSRKRKIDLIKKENLKFKDLSLEWEQEIASSL